ncbi:hypothetical protein GCM10020358_23800 [Amorphoplanes nipponensis]|uniref:DUF402 domain-containing protein n=1 Tax=Actinoplanes nipponensis TaxID=135950 RepID=UPI0031E8526A
MFFAPTRRLEMYCDITAPAEWAGPAQVSLVDLDLGVTRTHRGRVALLDEEESAAHQVSYGYPGEVIEAVAEAARQIVAAAPCPGRAVRYATTSPGSTASDPPLATPPDRPSSCPASSRSNAVTSGRYGSSGSCGHPPASQVASR